MSEFFVVTPIGFEKDTEIEIKYFLNKWKNPNEKNPPSLEIRKGGIGLICDLESGLRLNQHLKLATRILYRWHKFKAFHFNELEKILRKLNWEEFYPRNIPLLLKIESKQSKLGQEKRIFEVFKNAIKTHPLFSKPSEAPAEARIIFIDFFRDECKISFDTTGEPLYKRTMNKWNHDAPMRETIVHWGLLRMLETSSPWLRPTRLLDPFCGSGTMLFEALSFNHKIERPFSWETWPVALKDPKIIQNLKLIEPTQSLPFSAYFGIDRNQEALDIAIKNAQAYKYADKIEFACRDSLQSNQSLGFDPLWIFSNLPFGKRIKSDDLQGIPEKLAEIYKPKLMGLFFPEKMKCSKADQIFSLPIDHGGMKIYLNIFKFK